MKHITLEQLGLTEVILEEAKNVNPHLHIARVSEQHKELYKIITQRAEIHARVVGKMMNEAIGAEDYPVVGDWVLVDRLEDHQGYGAIRHILSRKSCFARKAAGTGNFIQPIAANIDKVFICMGLNNDFNLRRLERYLAITWESRAMPVVVLTKADLCEDLDLKQALVHDVAIGVECVVTSGVEETGWQELLQYMKPRETIAFLGSSGVGKSTLINALMGKHVLATADTRKDDKGRHTTTHRQLLMLPGGTMVIDTPGMRELQLAGADVDTTFSDIEELAKACRFADCTHQQEPGCELKQAIQEGRLSPDRLVSYQKLKRELAHEERKQTLNPSQAEKQKFINMMGSLNACKNIIKHSPKNKKK